jgi:hypothetical protein
MPAAVAADLVFEAMEHNELYLSPNGEPHLDGARMIAEGRLTAHNFFPQMYSLA